MIIDLESTLDRVYDALNWWLQGLLLGLSSGVRKYLFAERPQVVVRIDGNTLTLNVPGTEAVTAALDDGSADAAIRQITSREEEPEITVLLPRSVVLTHVLRFPLAAEAELRNVLRHELDRLTPFPVDAIVFDHRISKRNETALFVDLALMRRDTLNETASLLETLALRPTIVTTEDANGAPVPLNLLPHRRRLELPVARFSLRPALGIGAVLLLAVALYGPLPRYERVFAAHAATVENVRAEALTARARLAEQEAALTSEDFLATQRGSYVPPVELMLDLTTQIPEHTWLSRLALNGNELQLQGESAAATELLQTLESMELLSDVRFQAPISRNDESGKEVFAIVATLTRSYP